MPNPPLLAYEKVSVFYGPVQALHQVNLTVGEKEIVTLIGANGAGKSTLLMTLFSQPPISEGSILFNNKPIHHIPTHHISSLGIAIVPERRRIFSKLTVEENLRLGAFSMANTQRIKQNLAKNYELFPILLKRKNQRAGLLSGGEQQMLAIARALISDPKLLLLDEPSLGLAPQIVKQIFSILKNIAQSGTTLFLVEQNAHLALQLADRAYVLMNGKITLEGAASALLQNVQVQTAYLGLAK